MSKQLMHSHCASLKCKRRDAHIAAVVGEEWSESKEFWTVVCRDLLAVLR